MFSVTQPESISSQPQRQHQQRLRQHNNSAVGGLHSVSTQHGEDLPTADGFTRLSKKVSKSISTTTSNLLTHAPNSTLQSRTMRTAPEGDSRPTTKRAIEPASESPSFSSRMFVIPKKNGGYRPVFNPRALNHYVQAPRFKMESLQHVIRLIQKND